MTHDHFAYGLVNPLLAFGFALAGAFLGLICMVRARRQTDVGSRVRWLSSASLSIGGVGIWMMHFTAMIGFSVEGAEVRYDLGITIASLAISVVSTAFGLFTVGLGSGSIRKLLIGGPLTGLGVVAMHYTGMAALNLPGRLVYDPTWVAVSVGVAVAAATTALLFAVSLRRRTAIAWASLTMAIAVCGMHYSGMTGVTAQLDPEPHGRVEGVQPLLLLIPILVLASTVIVVLIVGVLTEGEDGSLEERPRRQSAHSPRHGAAVASNSADVAARRRAGAQRSSLPQRKPAAHSKPRNAVPVANRASR